MTPSELMVLMAMIILAPHIEGRIAAGVGVMFCLLIAALYNLGVW